MTVTDPFSWLRVGRLRGAAAAGALTLVVALPAGNVVTAAAAGSAKRCATASFALRLVTPATGRRPARSRVVCRPAAGRTNTPSGAVRALRATLPTPRELRTALPPSSRAALPLSKLTKLRRALERLAARPLAAAAAAAGGAGDCAAAPTFTIDSTRSSDGGVTAVSTGGGWTTPSGSTQGRLVETVADVGRGMTATQTTKECISWDPCPDANGIVGGAYEYSIGQVYTARADGVTVRFKVLVEVTAKLTARVGDDAKVKDFDWDAHGVAETGGSAVRDGKVTHAPTRMVRLFAKVRGVDPRRRDATGARPTATARGARGATLSAAELESAQAMYALADESIRYQASKALLDAESNWNRGKCLTIVFDPADPEVTPGQSVEVRVSVKAADGREANVPFTVHPYDGVVGPTSATSPATVRWTAPQQLDRGTFATFGVEVVSKRGKADEIHHAHAARSVVWFRVTFTGEGSYARHEMGSGLPQVDSRFTFGWTATTDLRFPMFDLPDGVPMIANADSSTVTGDLTGWRTDGGGRSGCSAAPEPTAVGVVRQTKSATGYDLRIEPFPWLQPPGGQLDCDNGAFLQWTRGTRDAMALDVHLTQADVEGRDTIEIPVTPQHPLDPNCWGGEANGDWPCEQSVTWHGTLSLQRIPTPAGRE